MRLAARTANVIFALALISGGTAWAQTSNWLREPPAGDWRVMAMRDGNVVDRNGEAVGKIVDFLMSRSGGIDAAIIDIGALTREANSQIAVPFDQLQISVAGTANAEDIGRGGTAPKTPSEPHLSGPQGSSVAGAVRAMENVPGTITISLSKDEIRKGPRFSAHP